MVSLALTLLAATIAPTQAQPAHRPCDRLLLPRRIERRPVVEDDLARLRDVGAGTAGTTGDQPFSVSPDGSRVALQVHRADPQSNAYCVAIVVIDLRRPNRVVVADSGDELIRITTDSNGRLDYPFGIARTIRPVWSADGSRVFYLKKVAGQVQAWGAAADGSGAVRLTNLVEGVDDLRYDRSGETLVIASRPDGPIRRAALETEGLGGYRYDDRFAPSMSLSPFAAAPAPTRYTSLSLVDGRTSTATREQAAMFAGDMLVGYDQGTMIAVSAQGRVATVTPDPAGLLERRQHLRIRDPDGTTIECLAVACTARIVSHWWSPDGSSVSFLRREGDNAELSAVYDWRPRSGDVHRRLLTSDLLFGCEPATGGVACVRETATRPRHLVLLTPNGKTHVAFDPNPEFGKLRLGAVQRLPIRDAFGHSLFADLVLPVGYAPGRRYPLVVVQYESRGFLRGGTGDEYPIQAFAGRGFAVLSMDRPRSVSFAPAARTFEEVERAKAKDFIYRRAIHSGIEIAIEALVRRGLVDPARVGLTGLSEGTSEVQWALIHDKRFAAVAMSGCCWGPLATPLTGLTTAGELRRMGYPWWTDPGAENFWREVSVAVHASEIRTPMLVQASDDELLGGVDAFTALRAANAPADLLVFPGEHHVKWQPAHRLALYRRNVDWFSFWLQDREVGSDLPYWRELRDQLSSRVVRTVPDWSARVSRPDQ